MARRIQCRCGKQLKVPDKFSGGKVRCTACRTVLKVKSAGDSPVGRKRRKSQPKSGGLALAGVTDCPGCGRSYGEETQICLPCGVNLRTGKVMYAPDAARDKNEQEWSSEEVFLRRPGLMQQIFDRIIGKA